MNMYTQVEDLEALLVLNEINYKKEVAIKELNNKRFDYYLPKYKLFIEFDGAQHHYPVEYFDGINGYIKRVNDDAEKTLWCKNNGFKFVRLNHLMSINMMWEILQYMMKTELYINESNVMLPYIDEWCELNLNQRDLYIKKLFDDYNKYLNDILGNSYKINDIEPFEIYIANYNDQIEYKGIIKTNIGYTKYYVNKNIDNNNDNDKEQLLNNPHYAFDKYLAEETSLLKCNKIPATLLASLYNDFNERNTRSTFNVTTTGFNREFSLYMEKLGYTLSKSNQKIRPLAYKYYLEKDNEYKGLPIIKENVEKLLNDNNPSRYWLKN